MPGWSGIGQVSSVSSESGFPEPGHLLLLRHLLEVRILKVMCTSLDTFFS